MLCVKDAITKVLQQYDIAIAKSELLDAIVSIIETDTINELLKSECSKCEFRSMLEVSRCTCKVTELRKIIERIKKLK